MSNNTMDLRYSDEQARRDIPSFIEQPPPLIQNPFMIPRPEKGINLLEKFEENSDIEDTELVQVYLRMKPCNVPSNLYEIRSDKCLITSLDTATAGHGRRTQHNVSKMYTFTRIFKPECCQKEIFEQVVKDNLKKLVDGHSFTLLTYGASGSGKTYTVMGTVNSPGLVPRSLEYLFKLVDAAQMPIFRPSDNGTDRLGLAEQNYELQWVKRIRQLSAPTRDKYRRMSAQLHTDLTISSVDLSNRTKYYVWVSFVEIYNENIYDLLAPPDKRAKLRIREDSSGNVYVKGVIQAFVRSGEEAYDVMVAGKHNLIVAATGVHAQSSRSHCIFTITMLTENDGEIRTSQVRLCDLAGCERQQAARNTGARMQESRAINSSLHVLERCLHMLRRKQRLARDCAMVPYRESKLTRLLGAGLSGARGEAVSMVVTLNPAPQHANQTKHVLSLAAVARDIQVNTTMATTFASLESSRDSTMCTSDEVMRLRAENERLHYELLQAQNCIEKLQWSIDEKQQENANTMREVVEETRESMKTFYESRLAAADARKKDMEEEYEAIIAQQEDLISKLMREVKEKKEYYIEEYIRERAEMGNVTENIYTKDESQNATAPRNYIESKDVSSDSDDEIEESLEPVHRQTISTIKKNASRLSFVLQKDPPEKEPVIDLDESNGENSEHETEPDTEDEHDNVNIEEIKATEDNFADDEGSKIDDAPISKDSLYATGDEDSEIEQSKHKTHDLTSNLTHTTFEIFDKDASPLDEEETAVNDFENDRSECEKSFNVSTRVNKTQEVNVQSNVRGTYFVNDSKETKDNDIREDVHEIKAVNNLRGSYVIAERDVSFYKEVNITEDNEKDKASPRVNEKSPEKEQITPEPKQNSPTEFIKPKATVVNKILKSLKTRQSSNSSLKQFEQIESACNNIVNSPENMDNTNRTFITNTNLPTLKEKKAYFDDSMQVEVSNSTSGTTENSDGKKYDNNKTSKYFKDSPEITKPSLVCSGKLCLLSSAAKAQEKMLFDSPNNEISSPEKQSKSDEEKTDKNINILRTPKMSEAKLYFDDSDKIIPKDVLLSKSPSLVRDDICQDYEPSIAVKKILGQNFAKPDVLTATLKEIAKRHESVDIFESPQVNIANDKPKPIENNILNIKVVKDTDKTEENITNAHFSNIKEKTVEIARKFNEILEENQSKEAIVIKQEKISLERTSFTDTQESKTESMQKMNENSKVAETNFSHKVAIKLERPSNATETSILTTKLETSLNNTQISNNTVDEFEKIVKDLTNVRATEFDLLVAETENTAEHITKEQNLDISGKKITKPIEPSKEPNKKLDTTSEKDQTEMSERTKKFEEVKYNLRNKGNSMKLNLLDEKKDDEPNKIEESEKPKTLTRRALRLRRRQNQNEPEEESTTKLKDIRNLEKEFSDVTLGLPAVKKVVKDIPSPEKLSGEEENLPPMMGIQSCPSKSVTRSRRKLFTPRAEALEESPSQAGDSNERIYVPRPSYHRARARRKL